MHSSQKFYLPWNDKFKEAKDYTTVNNRDRHSYKKNSFGIFSVENINWWNKPYFAILNEIGTVRLFMDAIKKNSFDEAKLYLSKYSDPELDIDEISGMFEDTGKYKYLYKINFGENKSGNVRVVSVAPKFNGSKMNSVINVKMISEPNRYGIWKIYGFEEDV